MTSYEGLRRSIQLVIARFIAYLSTLAITNSPKYTIGAYLAKYSASVSSVWGSLMPRPRYFGINPLYSYQR
jgi:hypothetical protein